MDHHPDLAAEQAYLSNAYACLAAMRRRTAETVDAAERLARSEGTVEADIVLWHMEERARALAETPAALCFGRLDDEEGDRVYVGRRHVEDAEANPVVVDWRARVSAPFYRATFADPMGLERRRRFVFDGRDLVDLFDEDFDDPETSSGGGLPDPLLAELERARTGAMRDIVATIQAEQDVIIRAPLDETVVVQGGPGTGKTAVGLHRAAFLLYEHRELLEKRRVLVVGPNRIFLRYISQVLPSLGETAVVQATLDGLVSGRYPVRATDEPDVAELKGELRMAEVLRRAVFGRVVPPDDDVVVATEFGSVRLAADDVVEHMLSALDRNLPANDARDVFRQQLLRLAGERTDAVRSSAEFKKALDAMWPSMSAPALVRQVLGNRRVLAAAAEGVLTDAEQARLRRRSAPKLTDERWTLADLPLLDEAEALISGPAATYGHVVVDEAQDHSAMALRMLARRSPTRSLTVLGDLAQATAVGAQTSWQDAIEAMGTPKATLDELTIGYRVPAQLLDFANQLLPVAAPGVAPSRSARTGGDPPFLVDVTPDHLATAVATEVAALTRRWTTIGVVAPRSLLDEVAAALTTAGIAFAGSLDEITTLLDPPSAKGLEFDAVVVVEPARFLTEEPNGHRLLYVALTRAVQHLGVVHAEPLPELLT